MRKSTIIAVALASAAVLPLPALAQNASAQAPATDEQAQFRQILDASYSADEPGVAVIVTRGGEPIYTDGIGIANAQTGAPITADTIFRYASISKQFAAATVMQMVDDGLLSLDDPLAKFLPDYPAAGAAATVRQLLNHTSGIKSYTGIPGWMVPANTARAWTNDNLIAEFADQPMDFAPGESFAYNNSAYILIGAIIESVAGRPWYEEVDARIAGPLGLTTLGYRTDEGALAGFATGYTSGGEAGFTPAQAVHPSVPGPAGALSGTVADMARWAAALHGGDVVSAASYAQMIAPTTLPDGETVPFGFGLVSSDLRGRDAIGHSGGIFGFVTDSIYLPEEDVFVAVFANTDSPIVGPATTMRRLAAAAIGEPYAQFAEVDTDLAAFAPLFGVYDVGGNATRSFFLRNNQLYTQRSGGSELPVYYAGDNRFFYGADSLTWFELVAGESGPAAMRMYQDGAAEPEIASRSGPMADTLEVPTATLDRYVGTYATPVGNAVLTVNDAGLLTFQLPGQPAFPMMAISQSEFSIPSVGAVIAMVEESGAVTGLIIRQVGQEVPGERLPDAE